MSNARRIADLLDSSGDVLGTNLDNVTTYSVGDGGLTTNDFTDADHTKLNAIEASATADQTGAEIKTAYEAEANAYTDTKDTKLSGIATSANNYSHPSGAGNSHIPTGGSVDQLLTNTASGTGTWQDAPVSLPSQTGNANKQLTTDGSTASWADTSITLDSPSITGTLSIDSDGTVTHTIGNWSEELTYVITPTNCTVGSINTSGEFVITHTSGVPSYTIKATTDNLGLDDSSLVTKNMVVKLTAPTISSPADTTVTTNVVYTVTSTDSNDDKIILDMGTSNFTYQSVDVGSGSKVGNTVEVTGFTTGNPAITVQFTALGTYSSVKAKSTKIDASYGDSDYSSTDSILIYEQLSAPSLNSPADSDDATSVTYTISSINANATKVIFDTQSSNFTYGSVGSGSGSKVGNTVEITGWSGTSVTVTLTYTTVATYSNRAKVTNTADATYTDSAYSSSDSIIISASWAFGGTNSGFASGGYSGAYHTTVDEFAFSSSSGATNIGSLTIGRYGVAGQSSTTHGYATGGAASSSASDVIDKFSFSSGGSGVDVGNLHAVVQGQAGQSSSTDGFASGGHDTNYSNVVNKFSYSSDGDAVDHGNLSQTRVGCAGQSSADNGYTSGGDTGANTDTIDKFAFSSNTTAADHGNLQAAKQGMAGQSSSTDGYVSGSTGTITTIDKFSFSSNTTASDHGDLSVGIKRPSGQSSTTDGYSSGGRIASEASSTTIDKFNFASNTTASDHGDLTVARRYLAGHQY